MSLVFDVMVLCFPLPVIKNLHMDTRRKLTIASIFWLGALYVSSPTSTPLPCRSSPLFLYLLKSTFSVNVNLIKLVVAVSPQLSGFGSCTKKFTLYRVRKTATITVKIPSAPHWSWDASTNPFTQLSKPTLSSGHTLNPTAPSLLRVYPRTLPFSDTSDSNSPYLAVSVPFCLLEAGSRSAVTVRAMDPETRLVEGLRPRRYRRKRRGSSWRRAITAWKSLPCRRGPSGMIWKRRQSVPWKF